MQDASPVVALVGLVVSLGASICWIVRHILTTTIPQLQAGHARQIEELCQAFWREGEANRQLALRLHGELLGAVRGALQELARGPQGRE